MSRRIILIALITISISATCFAQDTLWSKTYGGELEEIARAVYPASDGGFVLAGFTGSYDMDGTDFYLVRADAEGETVWEQTYGDMDLDDAYSVCQTSDGGYITVGFTTYLGVGLQDMYLVKSDEYGEIEWERTYGPGPNWRNGLSGCSVLEVARGGYLIAGSLYQFGPVNGSLALLRTDSSGDSLWLQTYGSSVFGAGSTCLIEAPGGGFVISGMSANCSYLVKTTDSGDTIWTQSHYLGARSIASSIKPTDDGGYIVVGTIGLSGPEYTNIYLMKTDEFGVAQWTRAYGGNADDSAFVVCQTGDGGYLIAGTTYSYGAGGSDIWLLRTDSEGDSLWTRAYGGLADEGARAMCRTEDGDFIVAGYTESFGDGQMDCWVLKIEGDLTDIDDNDDETLPISFDLSQNYPNPFNASTNINFRLKEAGHVNLGIFNIAGQKVRTLVNKYLESGTYTVSWNGRNRYDAVVPSGEYFYRLKHGDFKNAKKMMLIK